MLWITGLTALWITRARLAVDYDASHLWITRLTPLWISQPFGLVHISACWGVLENACRQCDTLLNNCGGGGDDKRGAEGCGVTPHMIRGLFVQNPLPDILFLSLSPIKIEAPEWGASFDYGGEEASD